MSNPVDNPNGIRGQRKGRSGRIFKVSINLPFDLTNFKGGTTRVEVFVPDNPTYQPVTHNSPLNFSSLRNVNGHWIPGKACVFNKPFRFYPPAVEGQVVHGRYAVDAKRQFGDRIEWINGSPTPQDIRVYQEEPFPFQTTPEGKIPQRPMPKHQTPVFTPISHNLLEKKLIDGKWGAYVDINFPEYSFNAKGKEWVVESDPIKNFFIPYTPEYTYYHITSKGNDSVNDFEVM